MWSQATRTSKISREWCTSDKCSSQSFLLESTTPTPFPSHPYSMVSSSIQNDGDSYSRREPWEKLSIFPRV